MKQPIKNNLALPMACMVSMASVKKYLKTSLFSLLLLSPLNAHAALYISIIQGLAGNPEYQDEFDSQRELLSRASKSMTDDERVSIFNADTATRENLLAHFESLADKMTNNDRAAIYLIGHGSYDGEEYKFNIPGIDITTDDLNNILAAFPGQNHFLLNTSSTSGAILEPLENDSRILITATRNGNEKNATHFGTFFAQALSSEEADLNKNNNISIQEAFDYAEREVTDFFGSAARLATEHPQIRGEGAAQFSLARITPIEDQSGNELISSLQEERLTLDTQIEELQLRRAEYSNADYIQRLQALILQSATLSEEITRLSEEEGERLE